MKDKIGLSLAYLSIPVFWMIMFGIITKEHLINFSSFVLILFLIICFYNFYKYEVKK